MHLQHSFLITKSFIRINFMQKSLTILYIMSIKNISKYNIN